MSKANDVKPSGLLAHCSSCHETFFESEVEFDEYGGDACPKCEATNCTLALDGDAVCDCGEGAAEE